MDLSFHQEQNLSQVQKMHMGMQFSLFIERTGDNFWESIKKIENSGIFRKLHSISGDSRVIRIQPIKKFIPMEENSMAVAETISEVESLLEGREDFLNKIRKMGPDNFRYYFMEGEGTDAEIADILGVPVEKVAEFRQSVIDKVHIADAFSVHIKAKSSSPLEDAEIVAELYVTDKNIQISYSRDRQRYHLDERKFEKLMEEGGFSAREISQARSLKIQIEQVNRRFNLLNRIVDDVVSRQAAFIRTGDKSKLIILEAKKIAEDLRIHPSWVSRLIKSKFIKVRGRLLSLRDLFISKRELAKQNAKVFMEKLLDEEAADIKAGRLSHPYSDATVTRLLFNRYRVKATRRTVNNWRRELRKEA
ncbi:MAG: hypothetical protein LWY06_00045 [Firmicutes bacterium]|nr:hypothetical protein [Bacillota bacterium]